MKILAIPNHFDTRIADRVQFHFPLIPKELPQYVYTGNSWSFAMEVFLTRTHDSFTCHVALGFGASPIEEPVSIAANTLRVYTRESSLSFGGKLTKRKKDHGYVVTCEGEIRPDALICAGLQGPVVEASFSAELISVFIIKHMTPMSVVPSNGGEVEAEVENFVGQLNLFAPTDATRFNWDWLKM